MTAPKVLLRLRVGAEQAHYGGGLVDGAFVLKLFGDAATELLVRHDGDEASSAPTPRWTSWRRFWRATISRSRPS